jgi:glycosyltransferase involved in cell wall biosynthesis
MKILIVASYNKGRFVPFVEEQAAALTEADCVIDFYGLQGKGLRGYLRNLPNLKQKIREFQPEIIHAHYGLTGLLANLQRSVPVVTTYHGSDINDKKALSFSKWTMRLSAWNIFVSKKTLEIAKPPKRFSLLPCGVDLTELQLTSKKVARQKMNLTQDKCYVLFAGAFDNVVKNASLAKDAIMLLQEDQVELLELKGYSREEVTLLMCAADAFLMTSFSEGSPQVIKEAMACGCPIVSVDVGDVKERTEGVEGCFVTNTRNVNELAVLLRKAMTFCGRTKGRERIVSDELDNRKIAEQLIAIYQNIK